MKILTILAVLLLAGLTSYYAVVKPTSEDKTAKVLEKHLTLEEIPSERDLAHIEDLSTVSKNPEPVPTPTEKTLKTPPERSREDIKQLIVDKSKEYGVDENLVISIIKAESQFNPSAVSHTGDYGLMQINLYYNPDVSYDCAMNPECALDWGIREIAEGRLWKWNASKYKWSKL